MISSDWIRFALDTEPFRFHPAEDVNFAEYHVMRALYDTLLEVDSTMDVQPHLAERWEQESPTAYRFHLRAGVSFQDGVPLTAHDAIWSLNRLRSNDSAQSSALSFVEDVEAVDELTFRVRLRKPHAPFLASLASNAGMIFSPRNVEVPDEGAGESLTVPVGTGPFCFVAKTSSAVQLVRYDGYWGRDESGAALPYAAGLDLPWYETGTQMLAALEQGKLTVINEVPYARVPELRERQDLAFDAIASHGYNGVRLNCARPPFDIKPLRQAFAAAVDRERMLAEVNLGVGYAMHGPIPPASFAYDGEYRPFTGDREQVRARLLEAGCPDGYSFTILIPTEQMRKMVSYMGDQLRACGIEMKIEVRPMSDLYDALQSGDYDALFLGASGGTDPDEVLYPLFHSEGSQNRMSYANPELDAVLERCRVEADRDTRIRLYQAAQEIIVDDSPFIFTRSGLSIIAKQKGVRGLEPHPDLGIRWQRILLPDGETRG